MNYEVIYRWLLLVLYLEVPEREAKMSVRLSCELRLAAAAAGLGVAL